MLKDIALELKDPVPKQSGPSLVLHCFVYNIAAQWIGGRPARLQRFVVLSQEVESLRGVTSY
jgi:hypothetical protein